MGHRLPHRRRPGGDGGPGAPGCVPQDRVSPAPTRAATVRPRSRSTRPGPSCWLRCVALVAHPDDERYQPHFGTTVRTPLYGVEVPIVAHALAQPDKGTGIAMICTFGDTTDVTWWRELNLPMRPIIGRDGRLSLPEAPDGVDPEAYARSPGSRSSRRRPRWSNSSAPPGS